MNFLSLYRNFKGMNSATEKIAVIQCSRSGGIALPADERGINSHHIAKVLYKYEAAKEKRPYPCAEVVQDEQAIFSDESIRLVVLASPGKKDLYLAGEGLRAGKNIRIL
jgi:hypothetical protein